MFTTVKFSCKSLENRNSAHFWLLLLQVNFLLKTLTLGFNDYSKSMKTGLTSHVIQLELVICHSHSITIACAHGRCYRNKLKY